MTSIGKTDEDPIPKEEIERRLTSMEKATVKGCLQELDTVKQKLENCYELLDRMQKHWGTTQQELNSLRVQYARLANVRVNGGPTSTNGS